MREALTVERKLSLSCLSVEMTWAAVSKRPRKPAASWPGDVVARTVPAMLALASIAVSTSF